MTISGDLRFRYDWDNEDFQYPGGGNQLQRSRYIFRVRLNLNYTLSDDFFLGIGRGDQRPGRFTEYEPISEGFDDYGIYLHQFILGWKPTNWGTVIIGKLFAPFYNNEDAMFDFGDINPIGLTEKLNFDITPKFNISANFGQYIFYDNPESGYLVTPETFTTTTGAKVVANVYSVNPAGTIPQNRKEDAILSYNDVVFHLQTGGVRHAHRRPGVLHLPAPRGSVGISGNAVGPSGKTNPNDINVGQCTLTHAGRAPGGQRDLQQRRGDG